ncbi:MAG: hypothetical protein DME76_17300, partial [Verrucomicrobia bacterium]
TWRDAVAFSLISVFAFYFHTPHHTWLFGWKAYYHHPLVDWKDIFGGRRELRKKIYPGFAK